MARKRGECTKRRHANKEAACIAAKRVKNVQMNVYYCDRCKAWHLGKSNMGFRKADRINQLLNRVLPVAGQRGT